MNKEIRGIHHITAICGDPQKNVDFYAGVLGLRLVKRTVNFDDPSTYHLYYGDGIGSPGTIMTFFPWMGVRPGRPGNGQVTATAFAIPQGAVSFWTDRLQKHDVPFTGPVPRFGEEVLSFADPDGLKIELIATPTLDSAKAYDGGTVPLAYAIHGFHGATLSEAALAPTATLLTETLGFTLTGQEDGRYRFNAVAGGPASSVDVLVNPNAPHGLVAGGSVHHIAWRTADDAAQLQWLKALKEAGYDSSPVMDRKYFHSIYFRERGGVLFEIATDEPGFAVDEPQESLGSRLVLPPWLEPLRTRIEAVLPPIEVPVPAEVLVR